jgi:hypothetical protein
MPFVTSVSIPEARHERIRPHLKANNPKGLAFNAIVNQALDAWLTYHEQFIERPAQGERLAAVGLPVMDAHLKAFFPSGPVD